MATELEELGARIKLLDIEDKYALLRDLMDELDAPPDPEIERLWIEEANRRLRDIEEGRVDLIDGETVFEEIRELVKR
jgi:putative addiction module component (TIGR02574 family)